MSKWESDLSLPDIERIVALSEVFDVSTDYLLSGKAPVEAKTDGMKLASRILYIVGLGLCLIGFLGAIGHWYEQQNLYHVFGGMVVQVVGLAIYFIGQMLSTEPASAWVKFGLIASISFIPLSLLIGFFTNYATPYPGSILHATFWLAGYITLLGFSYQQLFRAKR